MILSKKKGIGELLDLYNFSARNQIVFDKFYFDMMGNAYDDYHGIPRPAKWLNRSPTINSVIKKISYSISIVWAIFGFYTFSFLSLVKILFQKIFTDPTGTNFDELKFKVVGLDVCNRSYVVQSRKGLAPVDFWLSVDFYSAQIEGRDKKTYSLCNILNCVDLWHCFCISIKAHQHLLSQEGLSSALQSYTALQWVGVYLALKKLRPSLISTSEHHDRWAVLADGYCSIIDERNKCSLLLTQHGKEYRDTYTKIKKLAGNGLPYKLNNVSVLSVYNEDQSKIFEEEILSNECYRNAKIDIIGQNLELTTIDSLKPSFLIVGHKFAERFHLKVLNKFSSDSDLLIFYKPHPTVKPSSVFRGGAWVFIDDINFFPKVNFILSYQSTLVDEYQSLGVDAVVHGLNQDEKDDMYILSLIDEKVFESKRLKLA